jgi:hypothetical protein
LTEDYDDWKDCFIEISKNCKNLKTIKLHQCNFCSESGINELLTNCSKLENISLSYIYDFTDQHLISISNNCLFLKELDISYCDDFDVSDCENITNTGLIAVVKKCLKLKDLNKLIISFYKK